MTITASSCINICFLLLLFITLLLSFNDVSANPSKVKCDLIGKANNKNVMTQTTIMGATPTDATDLIAFSSDTYSKGSEQITVTLSNLQTGGAVIHLNVGTFDAKPTGFDEETGCTGTNLLYYKQGSITTSYTLTLNVPADISSSPLITVSVITASGYGQVKRQQKTISTASTTTCDANEPTLTGSNIQAINANVCDGTAIDAKCAHTCNAGYTGGSITCQGDGNYKVVACISTAAASASTTATPTSTPTSAPKSGISVTLDAKFSTGIELSNDKSKITFTATYDGNGWVGIGVGGNGMVNTDMVICSGSSSLSVQRYWSTAQSKPSNGVAVAGATCTQSGSKTVMKFTRNVANSGSKENAIKIGNGESTNFVYAYGSGNTLSYHSARNRKAIDVNSVSSGAVIKDTSSKTTTSAPSSNAGAAGKIIFDSSYDATVTLSADKSEASFVVTLVSEAWIGIGVGSTGMKNTDMVICSNLKVKRYWSTAQAQPSGGTEVKGATCTQSGGKTIMQFTRKTATSGSSENEIKTEKGTMTDFVWAYGTSNVLSYHNNNRGSISFDVASGITAGAVKKEGTGFLYAHMMCMTFAWGMLLPWGVSIASRSRNVEGAKKGAWFKVHKNLQYAGWFLQILGFIFAILMVEENGGVHFNSNVIHTIIGLVVVILGTLQPLNAMFRMHPPADGWPNGVKPMKRKLFEWVHKGSGRIATILGILNIGIGVILHTNLFDTI